MEFIEKTLGQIIGDLAATRPDGLAFKFADRDYRRTWKEFDEETTLIAKGFMALGVQKDEKFPCGPPIPPNGCLPFSPRRK